MRYSEIVSTLQKLTNRKIKQADLVRATGAARATMSYRESRDSIFPYEDVLKIEQYFNVALSNDSPCSTSEGVNVIYRPNVYLSAGYGIEVYNEKPETILLDKKLFVTDRGIKINPANCEIVTVSGNSMSPEYKHGDRVIIDHSVTTFTDGHIFAFRYNGECFMKEVCVIGKRIKCIPLNKEYEPFFIEPEEEVTIFGRILPRIRL